MRKMQKNHNVIGVIVTIILLLILFLIYSSHEEENITITNKQENIYAHISGAVNNPDVYAVNEGVRVFELIEIAGGYSNANESCINPAQVVKDEAQIYIPHANESCHSSQAVAININLANTEELQLLPGIGDATAKKIIDHRNKHGDFKSPEEIKDVPGIGESTYEKMEDYIVIN